MNYAELRTLTPELGYFTITGLEDELKPIERLFKAKRVSSSSFDRALIGRPLRRFALF